MAPRNRPSLPWIVRGAWIVLPIGLGPAAVDALDGWSAGPRSVAEVMLWGAWAVGVVAVFAPRPLGLALVRVGAAAAVGVALGTASGAATSPTDAAGALASAGLVAALAASPDVAHVFANGAAYGDEVRFPLAAPPVVALVAAPLAAVLAAAGFASGPLLVAAGEVAIGVPSLLAGWGLAVLALRSLHGLGRRWLVFVPGGVVVHDPFTLIDPVLLPRRMVSGFGPAGGSGSGSTDAVDLTMGVGRGRLVVTLAEPVPLPLVRRNRRDVEVVSGASVVLAVARPGAALAEGSRRRLGDGR